MVAVVTKLALVAAVVAKGGAVNLRAFPFGSVLSSDSGDASPKESKSAKSKSPASESPKKAATAAKPVSTLATDIKKEKAVLASLTNYLGQYKAAVVEAQGMVAEKEKAVKDQEVALKGVSDAVAKLRDAKTFRVQAAKNDMHSNPLTDDKGLTRKSLSSAETMVADAEKTLVAANKNVHAADSVVAKATTKADRALEKKTRYEERVKDMRAEADALAKAIKEGEEKHAVQENKMASAAAELQKQEADMLSAMRDVTKEQKASRASARPQAK